MTSPIRVFRRSDLFTQCEECKLTHDLSHMGACRRCRRVLCNLHLHGSFVRRLIVDLGAEAICVKCRESVNRESVSG
jgi:hypothetical protein